MFLVRWYVCEECIVLSALLTHCKTAVPGDACNPGAESRVSAKALEPLPCVREHILDEVIEVVRAENSLARFADIPDVRLVKLFERPQVTGTGCRN